MSVPTGTTCRQLGRLARWGLIGTVVLGAAAWWRPGYLTWGLTMLSVVAVLCLWLVQRTVGGLNWVPGHPFHLALVGPVALTLYHLASPWLRGGGPGPRSLAGGVNVSLLFQFAMLSAIVLLTQSLVRVSGWMMIALATIGAAVMGGAAAAVCFGQTPHMHLALGLLGLTGAAIWLTPLVGWHSTGWHPQADSFPLGGVPDDHPQAKRRLEGATRRDLTMAYAGVAVIACVGVLCAAPKAVAIAVCLASAAFFSAAVTFRHARRVLLALGVVAASATTLFLVAVPVAWRSWLVIPQGLGGIGERALTHLDLSVRSSGPAVLGGMFGWAGLGWLLAGLLICFAVLVAMADAKKVGAGRAVLWAITMLLSIAALLAPGGLFAPAFTIVAGFVWGLAPTMLGIRIRPRSGLLLLLPMLILTAIMGVVDNDGLLAWAVGEMGGTDKTIHATAGLLLTLGMAWFFGGRRVLPGLIAITIGGLIGGAGEGLQGMVSRRPMEWADWGAHAIGTGVAAVLYFLALGSRLAESPDAQARQHALRKYEG